MQIAGSEWDRKAHSYEKEKKRWRRMADTKCIASEKERLEKRDADRLPQLQAERKESAEERYRTERCNPQSAGRAFPATAAVGGHLAGSISGWVGTQLAGQVGSRRTAGAKYFSIKWKLRYLDSADFLDLLYRDDEPNDEFAYHIADACRRYREYVTDIRKHGAAFRLPTGRCVFYLSLSGRPGGVRGGEWGAANT